MAAAGTSRGRKKVDDALRCVQHHRKQTTRGVIVGPNGQQLPAQGVVHTEVTWELPDAIHIYNEIFGGVNPAERPSLADFKRALSREDLCALATQVLHLDKAPGDPSRERIRTRQRSWRSLAKRLRYQPIWELRPGPDPSAAARARVSGLWFFFGRAGGCAPEGQLPDGVARKLGLPAAVDPGRSRRDDGDDGPDPDPGGAADPGPGRRTQQRHPGFELYARAVRAIQRRLGVSDPGGVMPGRPGWWLWGHSRLGHVISVVDELVRWFFADEFDRLVQTTAAVAPPPMHRQVTLFQCDRSRPYGSSEDILPGTLPYEWRDGDHTLVVDFVYLGLLEAAATTAGNGSERVDPGICLWFPRGSIPLFLDLDEQINHSTQQQLHLGVELLTWCVALALADRWSRRQLSAPPPSRYEAAPWARLQRPCQILYGWRTPELRALLPTTGPVEASAAAAVYQYVTGLPHAVVPALRAGVEGGGLTPDQLNARAEAIWLAHTSNVALLLLHQATTPGEGYVGERKGKYLALGRPLQLVSMPEAFQAAATARATVTRASLSGRPLAQGLPHVLCAFGQLVTQRRVLPEPRDTRRNRRRGERARVQRQRQQQQDAADEGGEEDDDPSPSQNDSDEDERSDAARHAALDFPSDGEEGDDDPGGGSGADARARRKQAQRELETRVWWEPFEVSPTGIQDLEDRMSGSQRISVEVSGFDEPFTPLREVVAVLMFHDLSMGATIVGCTTKLYGRRDVGGGRGRRRIPWVFYFVGPPGTCRLKPYDSQGAGYEDVAQRLEFSRGVALAMVRRSTEDMVRPKKKKSPKDDDDDDDDDDAPRKKRPRMGREAIPQYPTTREGCMGRKRNTHSNPYACIEPCLWQTTGTSTWGCAARRWPAFSPCAPGAAGTSAPRTGTMTGMMTTPRTMPTSNGGRGGARTRRAVTRCSPDTSLTGTIPSLQNRSRSPHSGRGTRSPHSCNGIARTSSGASGYPCHRPCRRARRTHRRCLPGRRSSAGSRGAGSRRRRSDAAKGRRSVAGDSATTTPKQASTTTFITRSMVATWMMMSDGTTSSRGGGARRRRQDAERVARRVQAALGATAWEEADDDALCAAFAAATRGCPGHSVRTYRSHLRFLLRERGGGGPLEEAARRWPRFFTAGRCDRQTVQREVTVGNALPPDLLRGDANPAWRALFERLLGRLRALTGLRRPTSMRKALAFLYGFCRRGVLSEASDGGDLVQQLRTHGSSAQALAAAYRRYRHRGVGGGGEPGSSDNDHDSSGAEREEAGGRMAPWHAYLVDVVFHRVLRALPQPLVLTAARGPRRRRRLPGSRPFEKQRKVTSGDEEKRHTFTAAEVRALYLACTTTLEKALLTALFTTGMRINAFCTLRWPTGGKVGAELHGTEKGNVCTSFAVTPVLRDLLQRWLLEEDGGAVARAFLFAHRDHPDLPMSTTCARRIFHAVARRAGVEGPHVHPHTTRHTVAWTLYALGNTVDQVASQALPPLPCLVVGA